MPRRAGAEHIAEKASSECLAPHAASVIASGSFLTLGGSGGAVVQRIAAQILGWTVAGAKERLDPQFVDLLAPRKPAPPGRVFLEIARLVDR